MVDVSIQLSKLTLLLGANGSGKTQTIRCIRDCLLARDGRSNIAFDVSPMLLSEPSVVDISVLREIVSETVGSVDHSRIRTLKWRHDDGHFALWLDGVNRVHEGTDRNRDAAEWTILLQSIVRHVVENSQSKGSRDAVRRIADRLISGAKIAYVAGKVGLIASPCQLEDIQQDVNLVRAQGFQLNEIDDFTRWISAIEGGSNSRIWIQEPFEMRNSTSRPSRGIVPLILEYDDTFLDEVDQGISQLARKLHGDLNLETARSKDEIRSDDEFETWLEGRVGQEGSNDNGDIGPRLSRLIQLTVFRANQFIEQLTPQFLTEQGGINLKIRPFGEWRRLPRVQVTFHLKDENHHSMDISQCSSGQSRYIALTVKLALELALCQESSNLNSDISDSDEMHDVEDDSSSTDISEMIPDDLSQFDVSTVKMMPAAIEKLLMPLDEREQQLLRMRFGLEGAGEIRSFEEVAHEMETTRARIKQVEERARRAMNANSEISIEEIEVDSDSEQYSYVELNPFDGKVVLDKTNIVLLIDEPEAHLHPYAIRSVSQWLQYIQCFCRAVVVASHNPTLADIDIPESNVLLLRRSWKNQRAISMNDSLKERNVVLVDELGMTRGQLLLQTRLFVFVEGPHDKIIMDTFFGNVFENAWIRTISMHGSRNLRSLPQSEVISELDVKMAALIDEYDGTHLQKGVKKTPSEGAVRRMLREFESVGKSCRVEGHSQRDILVLLDPGVISEITHSAFPGWNEALEETVTSEELKSYVKAKWNIDFSRDVVQRVASEMALRRLIPPELTACAAKFVSYASEVGNSLA